MLLKSAAIVAKKVDCQLNAESWSGAGARAGVGVLRLGLFVNFVAPVTVFAL